MKQIRIDNLELKTFTLQDAEDYCLLNNINQDNIIELYLHNNELTDISGIKLFKNLKRLYLAYNKINNISDIENLKSLNILALAVNNISDISFLKNLKDLKKLYLGFNKIKDISFIKDLNKIEFLNIENLELESDQIQYIQSLKKLKELWCENGFKDIKIIKKLDKKIYKVLK